MRFAKKTISRGVGPRRMENDGVQASTRDVWLSNRYYLSFNRSCFSLSNHVDDLPRETLPILRPLYHDNLPYSPLHFVTLPLDHFIIA